MDKDMDIKEFERKIRNGKIIRIDNNICRVLKNGNLREMSGEALNMYEKCLNVIKLEQRIAEIDARLEEAEEAVISRRDEGLPTADAVQVVVELRRYRELNINKLKNYKKD